MTLCGWSDNHRSGTALAVHYTLQWYIQLPAQSLGQAGEHLLHQEYGTLYLTSRAFNGLTLVVVWQEGHPACKN